MQAGICVLTVRFGIRFDLFRFIQLLKNRQAINSSSIEFVLHFQLSDCHHCFVLSIVYFSYHGQHTIETIAATFQGSPALRSYGGIFKGSHTSVSFRYRWNFGPKLYKDGNGTEIFDVLLDLLENYTEIFDEFYQQVQNHTQRYLICAYCSYFPSPYLAQVPHYCLGNSGMGTAFLQFQCNFRVWNVCGNLVCGADLGPQTPSRWLSAPRTPSTGSENVFWHKN